MKLALKIVLVCLGAMILITAVSSYLVARGQIEREKQKRQSEAERVGDIVRESIELAYQRDGQAGIVSALRTHAIETGDVRYRWVWFDVSANDPDSPAASLESLNDILEGETDAVIVNREGTRQLHTYYPIEVNGEGGQLRRGAIELSSTLEQAQADSRQAIQMGVLAILGMTLVSLAIVGWAGVGLVGRPLKQLVQQTRDIGEGNFEAAVPLQRGDELGELSASLAAMGRKIAQQQHQLAAESTARLNAIKQLRHADRLKTVGRLAAGIAHEIGTPLSVVSGRAGLIRSGKLNAQEVADSAAEIQTESNRIAGIVRQLLDFARQNSPQRVDCDMREILQQTIDLLQVLADKHRVRLTFQHEAGPFSVYADRSQLQQLFTNLIVNAIQAMPDGGEIQLHLATEFNSTDDATPTAVVVTIRDQGCGMDADMLDQIFEPFFTTKEIGQGTGLGLSISFGIVEEHGGSIDVESQPGTGSTFTVRIPRQQPVS